MSYVKLEYPILVQQTTLNDEPHYHLKPIFVPGPISTDRRFEPAIRKLKDTLALRLKGFEINRNNADQLLWYIFNPEVHFHSQAYSFPIARQYFKGRVNAIEFILKDKVFVCLPAFKHFMFMVGTMPLPRKDIHQKIEETLIKLLKKERKEQQEDIDFKVYYAAKGDFITTVRQSVRIKQGSFHFEKKSDLFFFDNMAPSTDFDGGTEIEKVGHDLLKKYPDKLLRAFYQEDLVKRLGNIIFQPENTPIVLVGKEGVGKHSLIHEVIFRYRTEYKHKNREQLQTIWHLDPTRIIAGMSIVGMWQKRFEAIIKFALERQKEFSKYPLPDKLLFDNVIALLRIGKSAQNNMTLSDVLKPYLEKRKLQVLLVVTPEEWKIVQEKDRSFSDLFQVIRIPALDFETAVKVVLEQRKLLELEYGGNISIQAIHRLFTIQRNYLKNKALPGSVMKLLRQLVIKYKSIPIDLPEVRDEFQNFSGLETSIFDTSYTFEPEEVRKAIGAELIGQAEAVNALADVIHIIKAKLTNPYKPLGSFLFIGPTGVGKTQAAKALCKYLMGDEKHLMRFDMNEYIDEGAVHRLIGDYYNPEGQLTGKVRYNPFGILLLDEIEKAHPKVHDLLLQVLDDGRLTDSIGRTVDFTNTIIIMTSNVGAKAVSAQLGFNQSVDNDAAIYRKSVGDMFRPEFINRIGRIIIFKPLSRSHILNIARLQIKELLQRDGFVRRSTILNISQKALEWVAHRGYDARMGGRALKRQIERDLTSLSAEQLISTHSDQPIIFDIFYKNDKLIPQITPLKFVESVEDYWLPKTPDAKQGKRFYGQLLREIEKIEWEVSQLELEEDQEALIVLGNDVGESLNWQHYDFKNRIAEIKERVQTMFLGFRDRNFDEAPAIPLRLKGIRYSAFEYREEMADRAYRKMMKDKLFQQEGLQEITEYYRHAAAQFDSLSTEFIDNYLNVFFLKLASRGFLQKHSEKLVFYFETGITSLGQNEITYLFEHYKQIFTFLDFRYTENIEKNTLFVEGYSIYELFRGEEGIHLFYGLQKNMIPIKLSIYKETAKDSHVSNLNVVRIYNKKTTITDVRTGFSNTINISNQEFKLLLFAGVDRVLREDFA